VDEQRGDLTVTAKETTGDEPGLPLERRRPPRR